MKTGALIDTRVSLVKLEEGLVLVQSPPTIVGVSTAVLNSALPVNVTLRPVWKPSSRGELVMKRVGVGTRGGVIVM